MSDDQDSKASYCDLDRRNNIWVEGGDPAQGTGICLLDSMTSDQVVYTLQHNPKAKADLLRVTSDPNLHELAEKVELFPTAVEADALQTETNRNNDAGSIPFYAIFRGQPPFAQ